MLKRIIKNDLKNSKLISAATLLIITIAAVLLSLAVILTVNLSGAIDTLMDKSKTPHFMQMHSGEIDYKRLESFALNNDLVDEYQVMEFLNIEGSDIEINGKNLSDSIMDNGLTVQGERFDYILDFNNSVIKPADGEIYLPVLFMKEKKAEIGDKVTICGKEFSVAGFCRDSQMNSSLASSTRYLVSQNDYNELRGRGSVEYLIEFRLNSLNDIADFESQYNAAGLESNGPTLTYTLFKMINALSDGMMIIVILLCSILVLAIAFMCIRFTLLAKIEDDYREIGVMKAIGLRVSEVKKIYLAKYTLLAAVGCVLGYIISLPLQNILLQNIKLNMGESQNSWLAPIISTVGILLIFFLVIFYVINVLKRFKKISAADALRFNGTEEKTKVSKLCSIKLSRISGANVFLGIKDVVSKKRLYLTMLIVFILGTFIMIVPENLYNTISDKDFISYMGVGNCDIRIDLQQIDQIALKAAEITDAFNGDSAIEKYNVSYTKTFEVVSPENKNQVIKVELGNHSVFPIKYSKGHAPVSEDEIALSSSNADELNKKVGDEIVLNVDGFNKKLKVAGIYSDITNGGKTAKATFSSDLNDILWCVITAQLSKRADAEKEAAKYSREFSYAKVSDIDEYINQTFGSTKSSVKMAANTSMIAAILIVAMVTALFMKLLIAKDKYSIALMKSLGFNNSDITVQYISRSIFVLILAVIIGTLLANTLGQLLAGVILSALGADSFKFIINPVISYILYPIMLICTVIIISIVSTAKAGRIKICEYIKE